MHLWWNDMKIWFVWSCDLAASESAVNESEFPFYTWWDLELRLRHFTNMIFARSSIWYIILYTLFIIFYMHNISYHNVQYTVYMYHTLSLSPGRCNWGNGTAALQGLHLQVHIKHKACTCKVNSIEVHIKHIPVARVSSVGVHIRHILVTEAPENEEPVSKARWTYAQAEQSEDNNS